MPTLPSPVRPAFVPGVSQAERRPGVVDLGPGYPDPSLLPVELMARCASRAVQAWGPQTLSYGANAGPWPLRTALAARSGGPGGAPCSAEAVLTTGGISGALDHLAVRLALEGRAVLTESLTYDLGRRIFLARGVRTQAVPGPVDDLDVGAFRHAAIRAMRASGRPPALYLIPTFHNPTGRVLSLPRRQEVVALAAELGLLVIEDQAYAELHYGPPPPPSLRSCSDDPDLVVTLYSLSKCLAPGLRLGWLVAAERLVADLAADPLRLSGGGVNHFAAAAVAAACADGELDRHVERLRDGLRRRRDALLGGLLPGLPRGYRLTVPAGGFFLWVGLPPGVDDGLLLRAAEERGLSFAIGRRFGTAAAGVRLCFAAHGPEELAVAVTRFLDACRAPR